MVPKARIPFFLNRAGKLGELWIEDFDHVNEDFLKLRAKYHLSEVWRYFVPSMIELPIFLALHLSCSFERLL